MHPNRSAKERYIVQDRRGRRLFIARDFETFEDAWKFVQGRMPKDYWQDIYVVKKPG